MKQFKAKLRDGESQTINERYCNRDRKSKILTTNHKNMKTYLITFKQNTTTQYSAISGNIIDAVSVAIREYNLGYGINDVVSVYVKNFKS